MIENVKIAQSLESVVTADLKIEIDSSSIEIDFEEYRMVCSVTPDFTVRGFVEALVYFIKSDDESKRLTLRSKTQLQIFQHRIFFESISIERSSFEHN